MKAARLNEQRDAFQRPGDQLALVTGDAGLGEAGDVRIADPQPILDLVGEEAEPGAEHDGDARLAGA